MSYDKEDNGRVTDTSIEVDGKTYLTVLWYPNRKTQLLRWWLVMHLQSDNQKGGITTANGETDWLAKYWWLLSFIW